MGLEIERKFLIKNDHWRENKIEATEIKQGYLSSAIDRTVRVRVRGEKGILTIKGKSGNLTRAEFEYEIPLDEAVSLLKLCEKPIIEKTRYVCRYKGNSWEIDEFMGVNKGLLLAEVELESEDQTVEIPDWVGEEVSTDPKYYNSSLTANPYTKWEE